MPETVDARCRALTKKESGNNFKGRLSKPWLGDCGIPGERDKHVCLRVERNTA